LFRLSYLVFLPPRFLLHGRIFSPQFCDIQLRSCLIAATPQLLNTRPLNPEASCTNVLEETPFSLQVPGPPLGYTRAPCDAGTIVLRPMGLLVTAGCDTAWDRTQVCSDTSSTAMHCLRLLCYKGG
jgi:hypothetical protein